MTGFFRCVQTGTANVLKNKVLVTGGNVFLYKSGAEKHEYATKSLQLKKESHRVILVILYLFWGLPWKSGSQATSLSIFTKCLLLALNDNPTMYKSQGLCLPQNPEAKPGTHMQCQANFTRLGRPEHVWPTGCTELKNTKHRPLSSLQGDFPTCMEVFQNTGQHLMFLDVQASLAKRRGNYIYFIYIYILTAAHDASHTQKGVTLSPHDQTGWKGSCQTEGSSVETQGFMQNILRQKENMQWWGERCTFSQLVKVLQ